MNWNGAKMDSCKGHHISIWKMLEGLRRKVGLVRRLGMGKTGQSNESSPSDRLNRPFWFILHLTTKPLAVSQLDNKEGLRDPKSKFKLLTESELISFLA